MCAYIVSFWSEIIAEKVDSESFDIFQQQLIMGQRALHSILALRSYPFSEVTFSSLLFVKSWDGVAIVILSTPLSSHCSILPDTVGSEMLILPLKHFPELFINA